ncbi:MAG: sigma 54-interacting transcriptional regulator [Deltaproteobacteria bacterium]|nr:sigma 54-interacting transcriptional regulator [Deltaproteobacteria bacterium]
MEDATLSAHSAPSDEPASIPVLYVAFEGARPTALSARYSLADVEIVVVGRGTRRDAIASRETGRSILTVTIPDPRMSTRHATLERELGRWILADAGSKNGTFVDGAAIDRIAIKDDTRIEMGHTLFVVRRQMITGELASFDAVQTEPGWLTVDPELAHELAQLRKVAESAVPILVGGETGTGKELIARAVHTFSQRPGELVAVNCAAIPASLVESELFGVRKGAFSGAVDDRPGLIERADRGTLFLDEVGDLAPASQAALLRVLQEREVLPLGSTRAIAVDFRVIAATLHDLDAMVAAGRFRADLLARLAGFRIDLPAMRDRPEDLGILVGAILRRLAPARADRFQLSIEAARAIARHDWPHNVRELEKCLEAAIAMAPTDTIELEHLPPAVRARKASTLSPDQQARRDELIGLLQRHRGNISAIARELGKARMQIQRWIQRYRIDADQYRT